MAPATLPQHPLAQIKLMLGWFWDTCGKDGCKWHRSALSRRPTIDMMKLLAEWEFCFKTRSSLRDRRSSFDEVKFKRHRLSSHKWCFACGRKAVHRHHLIPLKNGGHNGKRNIVSLCERCHTEVHPWMARRRPTTNP